VAQQQKSAIGIGEGEWIASGARPQRGTGDVIIQSLVMSGEHSCGQLIVKACGFLDFRSPQGRAAVLGSNSEMSRDIWSFRRGRCPCVKRGFGDALATRGCLPMTPLTHAWCRGWHSPYSRTHPISILIWGSTTEMARSATGNGNVLHTMSKHFQRDKTIRNDGASN
jgi:hypothetical protein